LQKNEGTNISTPEQKRKEQVEALKAEWKKLWQERVDDKVRAEDIAINEYAALFVEQGTIIQATRDYKALNFKEILEKHQVENPDRHIQPNPQTGGWNKFIKTEMTNKKTRPKPTRAETYQPEKKEAQQPKKGGRGWLHK